MAESSSELSLPDTFADPVLLNSECWIGKLGADKHELCVNECLMEKMRISTIS